MSADTREMMVANGDVNLRVEVTGSGPVVLCVPGFPELASSWRHQVAHLTGRGHTVAVMDVRGYGGSSAPAEVARYRMVELASDVAAVVAALDRGPALLVGHDWGASIGYAAALRHPDRVRAVAGMSVPFIRTARISLNAVLEQCYGDRFMYMVHFQQPGVMEAEFASDPRGALKRLCHAASGGAPLNAFLPLGPREASFLSLLPDPPEGPLPFLDDSRLDDWAATMQRTGFVGALNRYRAMSLDVAADADLFGRKLQQPSCFLAGARDMVRAMIPGMDLYAAAGANCVDHRGTTIVSGAGHWVQQEAPSQVNAALDAFLASL